MTAAFLVFWLLLFNQYATCIADPSTPLAWVQDPTFRLLCEQQRAQDAGSPSIVPPAP